MHYLTVLKIMLKAKSCSDEHQSDQSKRNLDKAVGLSCFCSSAVSVVDVFLVPGEHKLLDHLGTAYFYLTLHFSKEYWQILLKSLHFVWLIVSVCFTFV